MRYLLLIIGCIGLVMSSFGMGFENSRISTTNTICAESVKYKSAFLPSCEEVYKKYDPRYKE